MENTGKVFAQDESVPWDAEFSVLELDDWIP